MRLVESAIVSNFERLKPPCDGVTADSVFRLFLPFLSFHIGMHMTLIWTVPEHFATTKLTLTRFVRQLQGEETAVVAARCCSDAGEEAGEWVRGGLFWGQFVNARKRGG